MTDFTDLDTDPACLRILMLLYTRRNREPVPKMTLRRFSKYVGVNPGRFDRTMKNLINLGLVQDQVVNVPGKKGLSKYPRLSDRGLLVAEQVNRINLILSPHTGKPVIVQHRAVKQ